MKIIKRISKCIFAVAFVIAGVNHFLNHDFYLRMMPPFLPAPLSLVYLSGVIEIALGVLLLVPHFSRLAAYGLIALLIAVFPANIYMAANPHLFVEYSPAALYLRLPLQLALIVWAFWFTKEDR